MGARNVILLVLDTVRADAFRTEAERLQSNATYTHPWTIAAAHYTTPSHASMFTGQLPSEHRVHSNAPTFDSISEDDHLIPSLRTRFDATAIGVSANGGFLSSQYGFDDGFDDFVAFDGNCMRYPEGLNINAFLSTRETGGGRSTLAYLRHALQSGAPAKSLLNGLFAKTVAGVRGTRVPRPGDYGAAAACRTVRRRIRECESEGPTFAFVNVIDAHGPFTVARGWDVDGVDPSWDSRKVSTWDVTTGDRREYADYLDRYRSMYRAAVRYLDDRVSTAIERLVDETDRDTTVIVTADHGEELATGGIGRDALGHRDLTLPVVHVPFAVFNPPGCARAWREQLPAVLSLLDLPAIVSAVMADRVPDIDRAVAPAEKLGQPTVPDDDEEARYWGRRARLAVRPDRSAVRWDSLGRVERLVLEPSAETRVETGNPVPRWAGEPFSKRLDGLSLAASPEKTVTPAVEQRLEELGYR